MGAGILFLAKCVEDGKGQNPTILSQQMKMAGRKERPVL